MQGSYSKRDIGHDWNWWAFTHLQIDFINCFLVVGNACLLGMCLFQVGPRHSSTVRTRLLLLLLLFNKWCWSTFWGVGGFLLPRNQTILSPYGKNFSTCTQSQHEARTKYEHSAVKQSLDGGLLPFRLWMNLWVPMPWRLLLSLHESVLQLYYSTYPKIRRAHCGLSIKDEYLSFLSVCMLPALLPCLPH